MQWQRKLDEEGSKRSEIRENGRNKKGREKLGWKTIRERDCSDRNGNEIRENRTEWHDR